MRKFLYYLLILSIILTAVLSFTSCTTPDVPKESESESESEYESENITPEPFDVELVKDGTPVFTVIRPDKADAGLINVAMNLRSDLDKKLGTFVDLNIDWSMDNPDGETVYSDESVHEILVGDTNRSESLDVAKEFEGKLGYCVRYVNGKIIIWGSNAELTAIASELFLSSIDGSTNSIKADISIENNLSGDGSFIGELVKLGYRVVYPSDSRISTRMNTLSSKVASFLSSYSPDTVEKSADSKAEQDYEILIGYTNRAETAQFAEKIGPMDYGYKIIGKKIVILGGTTLMTETATEKFISDLKSGAITEFKDGTEYLWDFDTLIEDSFIHRLDSFTPVWAERFTTPEWMLDFEEKSYAITRSGGRYTSDAHRGDTDNYPENSLECIYSSILLGADIIEIDPRVTKDNVMVLMHDATLTRTTNVNSMKGKNGLPKSVNVEDWTYEQLCQLRLTQNGEITDCRIPTVYEAMLLMNDRVFVHFDNKATEKIDKNIDVYEIAKATDSKETFIYYYKLSTMETWLGYDSTDKEFSDFVAKMRTYLKTGKLRGRNITLTKEYGDAPSGWQKQYNEGVQTIFTNELEALCKYIAQNQQPFTVPK